jgi:hypothetical protein
MADLVADREEDAVNKMDALILRTFGHDAAVQGIKFVYKQCGRPTGSSFWRDEAGVWAFPDGRTKPMRKLYYHTPTTERPNGGCYYSIIVIPADSGGYAAAAITVGKL